MTSARSVIRLARSVRENRIGASRSVESTRGQAIRCFSDDKGRVLSEEERAKETMYIQKMEKEILETKKRLEQHKGNEKGSSEKKPDEKKPSIRTRVLLPIVCQFYFLASDWLNYMTWLLI